MFRILKIVYREDRVTVEIDTGEMLSVPHEIYNLFRFENGQTIDRTEYQQLKEEAERFECRRRALNYLSQRGRSSHEIRSYLLRKEFSAHIVSSVVSALAEKGYLDDYEYAKNFIVDRKKRKPRGAALLRAELRRKGIPRSIAERALAVTLGRYREPDEAYAIALKKLESIAKRKNKAAALASFLGRRGYDSDTVRAIIERLQNEGHEI